MDIDQIYPSGEYLKAEDLQGRDVTVTIDSARMVTFDKDGQDQRKIALAFRGTDRELLLNVTNARMIADMHGRDTDGWLGRPITLYPTRVPFGGKNVDAIRIRYVAPNGGQAPLNQQQRPVGGMSSAALPDNGHQAPPPATDFAADLDDEIPF